MRTGDTIGTIAPDGLVVDGRHSLDVKGVKVKFSEAGTIVRGTLLTINTEGNAVKVKDTTSGEAGKETTSHPAPDCILTDDVEGEAGDTVYATAYKSGNFSKNVLEEKTEVTLTDEDIETMRGKGIFVENTME